MPRRRLTTRQTYMALIAIGVALVLIGSRTQRWWLAGAGAALAVFGMLMLRQTGR